MHVDGGIGQSIALALGTGAKQKCAHAGCQTNADSGHVAADELHGVVDRQAGADDATRAVDVEADVLIRILALQIEKLGDYQVGYLVADRRAQKDDALL